MFCAFSSYSLVTWQAIQVSCTRAVTKVFCAWDKLLNCAPAQKRKQNSLIFVLILLTTHTAGANCTYTKLFNIRILIFWFLILCLHRCYAWGERHHSLHPVTSLVTTGNKNNILKPSETQRRVLWNKAFVVCDTPNTKEVQTVRDKRLATILPSSLSLDNVA
jgi:hypothetical protein